MKKRNPYEVNFTTPHVATDMRIPVRASSEQLVGRDGHLNASSKKDLATVVSALMEFAKTNDVMTEQAALSKEQLATKHREMLTAAFTSKDKLAELAEVMADELYITANRDGFMRRFLAKQELSQGQIPVVRMRMKNVVATVATSAAQVETQLVRDNTFYPPEFYIMARPFIEQREIDRSNTDVLEEKYIETLEAVMVGEDRVFKRLVDNSVGQSNGFTNIVGSVTPLALGQFRNQVTQWGVPARYWLIANDIWNDIIGDGGFQSLIDQVSKHDLLLTGELGTILGMTIVSDGFRHQQHKVLDRGEMYILGDATNLGQYTDRGGLQSLPIDASQEKIPGRGWTVSETLSCVLASSRAVAKGRRI
jgi:hypothetical protein